MSVDLIGPDGREYVIDDPAKLPDAVKLGYRQATPEAPQTLGEQVRGGLADVGESLQAGVQGAVEGLAPGVLGAASPPKDVSQYLSKTAEEHPIAHIVGEGAGMLASPVNKVGAAITGGIGATTAIGRVGAEALAGGAVGSLFGAGNTLSEAALGDQDLTAQKLIAGAGLGALLGAGGGLFGATLGEAWNAAGPKLGKAVDGAQDWLGDFANNRALRAAGATKSDLSYLGEDKAAAVGKELLEGGHFGTGLEAKNAAGVLESVSTKKEVVGKALGDAFDAVHQSGVKPEFSKVLGRLDQFEGELSPLQREAVAADVKKAKDAVLEYGSSPVTTESGGFKGLNELKQDLQAKAKWSNNVGNEFAGGLRRQLSGIVRDELDTQLATHLSPEAFGQFKDAKKLYGVLSDAERVAEHGVDRLGGNASFGLRDIGLGAAVGLGHGNPVTGIVAAIANKTMRERGQGVVARLADAIAKSPRMSVAATSFGKQLQAASPHLGQYAAPLLQALARSPQEALATHMTLAQADPHYKDTAARAGFLPETPQEHARSMTKADKMVGVAKALDAQNRAIDLGLSRVFKSAGESISSSTIHDTQDFGAKRMRRDSDESHAQRVKEIQQLATNPQALVDRVAANLGNFGDTAPGVASSMTRTAANAVAYLASKVQAPPKAGPLAANWTPTEAEIHDFSQSLQAIQDPMSILRDAAAGTLEASQLQAVGAVYPLLAKQIQDKALEMMAAPPESVPYRAKMMLGLLTGIDPDGTMGESIAMNQDAIGAGSDRQDVSGKGAGQPSKDAGSLGVAQRMATTSHQRDLLRGNDQT